MCARGFPHSWWTCTRAEPAPIEIRLLRSPEVRCNPAFDNPLTLLEGQMSHSNFTTEQMFHAFGSTLLCYLQSMIINALIFKKCQGMALFRREKPSFPKLSKNLVAISAILVSTCKLRFFMFPLAISKQLAQPLASRQFSNHAA